MRTRTLPSILSLIALCLFAAVAVRADDAPKPTKDQLAQMAQSLQWQTGTVTLKDGLAKINLSDDFRFLGSADAQKVLHDMWGNPPNPSILGMIFPRPPARLRTMPGRSPSPTRTAAT